MPFEGMDVAEVTRVGQQLKTQAAEIDKVIAAINGLVGQLPNIWHGKDATEFESWWNSQHRPALQQASTAVNGLGDSALRNAEAQTSTSST